MKKYLVKSLFVLVLLCAPILAATTYASVPPPPPPGHGETGNLPPATPIGSGLLILASLAVGYGAKKIYSSKKEE